MIKRLLIFISIITILGCSSGDIGQDQTMVDKITPSDTIFTFDSLSKTGFKKNKTYNVENLPNADSAYFGWKKFGSEGPKDFEIRFYKSMGIRIVIIFFKVRKSTVIITCMQSFTSS